MTEIIIRDAHPGDYAELFALIAQTLNETEAQKAGEFSPELWRWQSLSPGFESIVVVAADGESLAGCYHLVSRQMSIFGKPRRMVLLQELAVLPEYRRQGIFMRMSEFALAGLSDIAWDVTYSFPNENSFPGFIKKQGYLHVANAPVMVRPLDWRQLLDARLPFTLPWHLLGSVANGLYNAVAPFPALKASDSIEPIEKFSSEVNDLSQQFLDTVGIGCVRGVDYLNWRFISKPGGEYSAWGLRREGLLRAYLVTRHARLFGAECVLLMDFGCYAGEEYALLTLIANRMRVEQEQGATLAVTMGMHPFFRRLHRMGFVTVPTRLNPRPIHFIVQRHTERVGDEIYEPSNWFTSLADWDVF